MPQAIQSVTTIPSADQASTVIYLPEVYSKDGNYFPETTLATNTTKYAVAADIAFAQHDDVRRVLAFHLEAGTSWDASREIAEAVLDIVIEEYRCAPAWCVNFLDEHLGVGFVARAEREVA